MPAIRFRFNSVLCVADHSPLRGLLAPEVFAKDGTLKRVGWAGFICLAGTRFIPGSIAKMSAFEVTKDDALTRNWRKLKAGEYVLCWRVVRDESPGSCAIYAIVDDFGWPIVAGGAGNYEEGEGANFPSSALKLA